MTFMRVNFSIVLVLLACSVWPVAADETRDPAPENRRARKRSRVVQVSNRSAEESQLPDVPTAEGNSNPPNTVPATISARVWTLRELESIANSSHPMLQRDISRIDAARGDALQAGLYPNPRFDSNNPQVFAGQNSLFNAGVMQEFVVKGKKRLDRAAEVKTVQQSEFNYVQNRFSLMTALRQQYYVVLAAERRVKALKSLQKITSESVETGKLQVEKQGELASIDVYVLELDRQRVESDLENAIRLLRGARNQLSVIVGEQSIHEDQFEGSIYAPPPQYDEETLNQFVSISSAPIEIQKLEIERNEILLKRAIVEPYPNVTLGPAIQWGLANGSEQYWLSVTMPLPTWDRNQGNIQSQRADLAASRQNLAAMQLEQLRRVAETFARHRAVRIQAAKYKNEIIPNALKTLTIARKAYFGGEYDFPRFLQIQRTFVEVNMTYIDLLESVWTSAAELSGLLQLEEFQ